MNNLLSNLQENRINLTLQIDTAINDKQIIKYSGLILHEIRNLVSVYNLIQANKQAKLLTLT